jgi:hypothetical protein
MHHTLAVGNNIGRVAGEADAKAPPAMRVAGPSALLLAI